MPRVNYANGKIYKIIPTCEFEEGDIYIGCTAGTLHLFTFQTPIVNQLIKNMLNINRVQTLR